MATKIESLEARRLLALLSWDGGADDATWNLAGNWTGDVLPAIGDNVVINISGPQITLPNTLSLNSLTVTNRTVACSPGVAISTVRIESELRIGSGATLMSPAVSYLTLEGPGKIEVESGGNLYAEQLAQYTGSFFAKMPITNRGTIFVSGGNSFGGPSRFSAGIVNYGTLTISGFGRLYGGIVNETGGLIRTVHHAWSPASTYGPTIAIGLDLTESGSTTTAPIINRGTIQNDYPATATLPYDWNNPANPPAGLTVYVDSTFTIGGTWGTGGDTMLKFARFFSSGTNATLAFDSTFHLEAGTLVLSNVDATVRGMTSTTGLILTDNTRATFADTRNPLAYLSTHLNAGFQLAAGDRILHVEDLDIRGSGTINIGDGLLIHGNRPGFMRTWITNTTPATTPNYATSLGGTFSGSPLSIEPNGNPRAVGYATGAGLASYYPAHTFRGETFDDNDFVFFTTLRGDANFDRQVNFDDLLVVAKRFGQPASRGYADGNFSGSVAGSGVTDFDDLLVLAQNYGATFNVSASRIRKSLTAAILS